jgi:Family of unknown function (DUF6049)
VSRVRAALRAAVAVGVLALALAPATTATAADDAEPAARIALATVSPDLVTASDTVHVTGTVTNAGAQPLDQVSVRLRPVAGRLGTRVAVATWLSGQDQRVGTPVSPTADLPDSLAPGARAAFALDVPAAALGLGASPFGVYPLAVDVRATPEGAPRTQVALVRTTFQWQPATKQYAAQQLAWLVPFTGLPAASGDVRSRAVDVAAAVAPGSRLRHLLDSASAPGVVWAVDPQLLTTLQDAASPTGATPAQGSQGTATTPGDSATGTTTPSAAGTPAPTSSPDPEAAARAVVRDFLAAMRTAAVGRDVIELPYADTDLQPVSDVGAMALVDSARAAGAGTIAEVLGVSPRTDLAWPANGYADDRLSAALAEREITTLVLDARTRPLTEALSYTTDARTSLPGGSTAVLFDPTLSALAARVGTGDAGARSRFLAETAAATTERPGLSRRLLVALPRTVDPRPTALHELITRTSSLPWLHPIGLSQLLAPLDSRADTSTLSRQAAAPRAVLAPRGVTGADVARTLALRGQLSALGEVVDDAVRTTAQLQRSTLSLVSSVWRGHRDELAERQSAEKAAVDALTRRVRVLPTTITFLRSSGELQLTISNDLDQPVHDVRLRVVVPSPRLLVSQEVSDPVTLPARSRASVRVSVRALASGQVDLQAQLVAPSGAPIGDTEHVKVRVRPTDSWVLTAGGAVAGLAVVVGLVRALRRPRRRRLT